jgi:hypothetical protein
VFNDDLLRPLEVDNRSSRHICRYCPEDIQTYKLYTSFPLNFDVIAPAVCHRLSTVTAPYSVLGRVVWIIWCTNWYLFSININLFNCSRDCFCNRVLRSIFVPKRDEVTGGWRKLHNKELHNLYSTPSIIRMIKLRRMRCTGHRFYFHNFFRTVAYFR